jgi:hypothetical protein
VSAEVANGVDNGEEFPVAKSWVLWVEILINEEEVLRVPPDIEEVLALALTLEFVLVLKLVLVVAEEPLGGGFAGTDLIKLSEFSPGQVVSVVPEVEIKGLALL